MTMRVTPASRPSRVRWVEKVAMRVRASRAARHHLVGKGLAWMARLPRQRRTMAARRLHHQGRLGTWGTTMRVMTERRKRVSRVSLGRVWSLVNKVMGLGLSDLGGL